MGMYTMNYNAMRESDNQLAKHNSDVQIYQTEQHSYRLIALIPLGTCDMRTE